jgi:hypothetical protein
VLGNEVLRRLVGSGRYAHTEVLATEAMATSLSGVGIALAGTPCPIERGRQAAACPYRPHHVRAAAAVLRT